MPEGVVVYFAVSAIVAALVHWHSKRYFIACGISSVLAPLAFALVCALFADFPTAVELKIVLLFGAISLLIASIVGLAFVIPRRFLKHGS